VVVAGDAITVTRLPLRGSIVLGRDEGCEVHIDNRSVSRRHARLHLGSPPFIEDLGGVNGTFVSGPRSPGEAGCTQPLRRLSQQRAEIAVGERFILGSVTLVLRRAAAARPPGAPEAHGAGPGVVVRDAAMKALYEQAGRAARSTLSVLILGETGVGKEVLARAVHAGSPRARAPYLELNCAALPPSLLEGELFGHEKNAFTGANQARPGLIESADGGTVFLDEVGELPLGVQVKLLRVLEDRKVLRLGGREPRRLDVRFIAATNRDLEAEIQRGSFRQDLYFRLNGVSFVIPPLRTRVAEIAPLAELFLADACQKLERGEALRLSPRALEHLERHPWPGNVRELRNVVERAAVLCSGHEILPEDLPAHLTGAAPAPEPEASQSQDDPKAEERRRILDALERCAGNQTRAAKLLGVSLRTLVNRLDEHGIPRPRKSS
jgi:DNA-binding NtrC family response regulator